MDSLPLETKRKLKVLVCVKQVPDTEARIFPSSNGRELETKNIKWIVNPYDEHALEEAIRLREKYQWVERVVALSLGPPGRTTDALRSALARGADEAVFIPLERPTPSNPLIISKIIASYVRQYHPDFGLILGGLMAIDDHNGCFGPMLAEALSIPCFSGISKISPRIEGGQESWDWDWEIEQEREWGVRQISQARGPLLVTAHKNLNHPRFVSVMGIMNAKKKNILTVSLPIDSSMGTNDLGEGSLSNNEDCPYPLFTLPPEKPPVRMIEGSSQQEKINHLIDLVKGTLAP